MGPLFHERVEQSKKYIIALFLRYLITQQVAIKRITHHTSLRLSPTNERTQYDLYLASIPGGTVFMMMEVGTCGMEDKLCACF